MDLFVIDLDDPRERWEELYRTVERTLADPDPKPSARHLWAPGSEIDALEILHVGYWNGA